MKQAIIGFESVTGPPKALLPCDFEEVRDKWAGLKRTRVTPIKGIKVWKLINLVPFGVAETPTDSIELKGGKR